jgi:hypothetical protein
VMLWRYYMMQRVMDRSPMWLPPREKRMLQMCTDRFLKAYQWLAHQALAEGRAMWSVRPKMHYVCHLMDELDLINLNPRATSCWESEKWLGKIKRFLKATHSSRHASLRGLQRYAAYLQVRFLRRRSCKRKEML